LRIVARRVRDDAAPGTIVSFAITEKKLQTVELAPRARGAIHRR